MCVYFQSLSDVWTTSLTALPLAESISALQVNLLEWRAHCQVGSVIARQFWQSQSYNFPCWSLSPCMPYTQQLLPGFVRASQKGLGQWPISIWQPSLLTPGKVTSPFSSHRFLLYQIKIILNSLLCNQEDQTFFAIVRYQLLLGIMCVP